MATINRYTQHSNPRYSPRTLQELMLVPAYKREQHNAIDEGIASADTQLAQYDGLDIHDPVLLAERDRLNKSLSEQSQLLEQEGFSPASKSNFLRFNKDFQNSIGPKGVIGKGQAAKAAYEQEKETFIANATKKGFSAEAAGLNWEDHYNKYKEEFNTKGVVKSIDSLYSPNYIDAVTEFRSLLKDSGMSSTDISNIGSKIIFDEEVGSYVLTSKGREATGSNAKNLQAALEYMQTQISNPNSSIGKSMAHSRQTPEDILSEVQGLEKVYRKNTYAKETGSQISNFTAKKVEDNKLTGNGIGITLASEQFAPAEYSKANYNEIVGSIKDLENSENLTDSDKAKLSELNQFKDKLDKTLGERPEYLELNKKLDVAEEYLSSKQWKLKDDSIQIQGINNRQDLTSLGKKEAIAQLQRNEEEKAIKNVSHVKDSIDEYTKPFVEENVLKLTGYQMTPYTPKQASLLKIANQNIENLFKANVENIASMVNIENVRVDGKITKPEVDDVDGIAEILYNSKPGSVQLTQVTPEGFSGKPEYVLRIETSDKSKSYNMKGFNWEGDDIGGGEPVEIRVSFNDIGNGLVNNVNGLIQNYVASTGPTGQELVNSMEINRMKSTYRGSSWGDLEKVAESNPVLQSLQMEELIKVGVTPQSSDEEIDEALEKIKNKVLY